MARGLDHIVHAVSDLDAAAQLYRRMGFTVGARNRHPWGTHNHIVQLPGFFIEILTMAEPEKLGSDGLSKLFGAFHRDYLSRRHGYAMLILQSNDAAADEAVFRAGGIALDHAMRFERTGQRPDGTPVQVAFSLAFAHHTQAPDTGFATCQQHFPENFWNPAFQRHDNGAQCVAGVVMVAADPGSHRQFLETFTGAPATTGPGTRVVSMLPRGEVAVMDPQDYKHTYAIPEPAVADGARLAGLRIAVDALGATETQLQAGRIDYAATDSHITIGPETAMGATIVFEPKA